MNRLEAANKFIEENKHKVTNKPYYHFTTEIGWLNDPNGFSFYNGEYHLFYQYNPYDIIWDNMHWGHATTTDFMKWKYHPVSLANDKLYDANGCFSGSAIEKDGKLYAMYTGHLDPNLLFDKDESQVKEYQCLAISEDGIHFEKHENNPVIAEAELPDGYMICDFRDPKVWEKDGKYYCVLIVRNRERRGEIVMYASDDMIEWTFDSSIYQTKYEDNTLLECPDYFHIDGKDVLVYSIMPCDPEFEDTVERKTAYAIGKLDYEAGVFTKEAEGLLDYGTSFYAPQSTEGKNGERYLIGWMQSWTMERPPEGFLFNGMMSIVRDLSVKDNILIQRPVDTIAAYFKERDKVEAVDVKAGCRLENAGAGHLKIKIDSIKAKKFVVDLNKLDEKSTRISVDLDNNSVTFTSDYADDDPVVIDNVLVEGATELTLDVYIDRYSTELFVNEGEKVCSFTSYLEKGDLIEISGDGILEEVTYAAFHE